MAVAEEWGFYGGLGKIERYYFSNMLYLMHFPSNFSFFFSSIVVRLSESLYTVKSVGENSKRVDELNRLAGFSAESSCLPAGFHEAIKFDTIEKPHLCSVGGDSNRSLELTLHGHTMYIDSDISNELRIKVEFSFVLKVSCFFLY